MDLARPLPREISKTEKILGHQKFTLEFLTPDDEACPLSDMKMHPSRPKVFFVTTAGFFLILFAIFVMIAAFCGKGFPVLTGILGSALAASGFGLFSAIMFTPAEIDWDEDGIRLRGIFPGDGDYPWDKLEAYSPVLWGVFGIQSFKFEGQRMPYQIEVAGLNGRERKAFQQFLRQHFPEKRRWVLVGFSRRK